MVKASAEILIRRPPDRVYGFVAKDFFANYPRWSPEVRRLEVLTPGPIRVGSRARQVRVDRGRRSEATFSVTVLDEPYRLEFAECTGLFRIHYRMVPAALQPPGEDEDQVHDDPTRKGRGAAPDESDRAIHTRLTFAFELARLELYMRPFERLIRSVAQEGTERVVRSIKGLVEREVAPPPRSFREAERVPAR